MADDFVNAGGMCCSGEGAWTPESGDGAEGRRMARRRGARKGKASMDRRVDALVKAYFEELERDLAASGELEEMIRDWKP